MHISKLFSVFCVAWLSGTGVWGCSGTKVDLMTACEFSGGYLADSRCVCAGMTCDEGVLCNTETLQCSNLGAKSCGQDVVPVSGDAMLSLWTADARAKKELISYIELITKPGKDFVPVERCVAVFDLDGTLLCETDPNYIDYNVYVHRVLEDPDYKDKATASQIDVANKIVQVNNGGPTPEGLDVAHQIAYMEVFSGMTLPEYNQYIKNFLNEPAPGYEGMKRGESFYKPMLEVIKYLQANQFTVYIVSGTDRLQVRVAIDGVLDIPAYQVIGSDGSIVATGQDKTDNLTYDNLNYVYRPDDELIRGKEFIVKNLKMNKVAVIAQEIGVQPVLSFGNSTGDASMAEYVISHNPYPSKAFMLLADDLERENGNQSKADKMAKLCEDNGWIPISMKHDWTTIYGDGVTRKRD